MTPASQALKPRTILTLCSFPHLSKSSRAFLSLSIDISLVVVAIAERALLTGISVMNVQGTTRRDVVPAPRRIFRMAGEEVRMDKDKKEMEEVIEDPAIWNFAIS